MKTLIWIFLIGITLISSIYLQSIYASDEKVTIKLRYFSRPPFVTIEEGKVGGLCGETALKAFEESKIPFELIENPPYRQYALLKSSEHYDCSMGWFKTPDREKGFKFTMAICNDGPWIAIGHKGTVDPNTQMAEVLLKNKKLKAVNRKNYSFGALLDRMVRKYDTPIIHVENSDFAPLLEMINAGHADYTFLSLQETEYLLNKSKWTENDFVILHPKDVSQVNPRHIICSRKVSSSVIRKLNKAITEINSIKTESK